MQVRRRRGRLRLEFDTDDAEILRSLFEQLLELLDGADGDGTVDPAGDEVLARLFPDGHRDDPQIAAEFRDLTQSTLADERRARIEACRADLGGDGFVDVQDPATHQRWVMVLNDLRLAIGTRLGVGQDEPDTVLDPASPDVPRMVYHWLSGLQDSLVTAVMDRPGR